MLLQQFLPFLRVLSLANLFHLRLHLIHLLCSWARFLSNSAGDLVGDFELPVTVAASGDAA
jgi:hypothetical protein